MQLRKTTMVDGPLPLLGLYWGLFTAIERCLVLISALYREVSLAFDGLVALRAIVVDLFRKRIVEGKKCM